MADSWENADMQQTKKTGGSAALNPGASEFTFNPSVASWTPGGTPAAAPAAPAAPGTFSVPYFYPSVSTGVHFVSWGGCSFE